MARLLYDLTGLLHWYAYFRRPAGVQRVIEQLATCPVLQQAARPETRSEIAVEFVVRVLGTDRFCRLDPSMMTALADHRKATILRLRQLFAQSLRLAPAEGVWAEARYFHLPYLALGKARLERVLGPDAATLALTRVDPPTAADVYFNPGDLWWQKGYAAALGRLRQRTGVRIVQMIHDLYVSQRPDWSPAGFSATFARQFHDIAPHVDVWLTSSKHVGRQLGDSLRSWGLPSLDIQVLPMGWDSFSLASTAAADDEHRILDHYGIGNRSFILFVGTVEPRKNLAALLDAMESLCARLGKKVPALVVAGGYGWRARTERRRLNRGVREGRYFWVRNLSDAELRVFYKQARFTVMPSHGEGWGLAVQESIALGVPCIASSGGATAEAGGEFATYFDPGRVEDLEAAIAAWIIDGHAVDQARARIERALRTEEFSTWNDAGKVLLASAFPMYAG